MKYDVVIIGGNPAGGTVASTARMLNPEKSVLVIRKEEQALIPCGIPYTFGTLDRVEDDIKSIEPAKKAGIEFLIDEVVSVDGEKKSVRVKRGDEIEYDKLVFATGSAPFVPPIEGRELEGVLTIRKELDHIRNINGFLKKAKNIVVVGAGFIGLEMSDELAKLGGKITLVEALDSILPLAFDSDMIEPGRKVLEDHGVDIRTGTSVRRIVGEGGKVAAVEIWTGEKIIADAVILSIGYRPNTELAVRTGLETGSFGGIKTDEYMRTSVKDVFAVGDCAEHRDFFTRKTSRLMLASTAASEARVAGINLFDLRVVRQGKGSVAVFSTSLDDISLGAAGLTEKQAEAENFHVIVGRSSGKDRHPGKLPDSSSQNLKLIFSRGGGGVLLGAQVSGGNSTGEMINTLGIAIQKHMTASELAVMQYGTQPRLTAGPGVYPIVLAALDALKQLCH